MTCSVVTCERPAYRRGVCNTHYARFLRYGDVQADRPVQMRGTPTADRLAAKLDKTAPGGCWVYTAGKAQRSGHKQIWHEGGMRPVHRVAWELAHGPIPDGLCVLHRCDNPRDSLNEIGVVAAHTAPREQPTARTPTRATPTAKPTASSQRETPVQANGAISSSRQKILDAIAWYAEVGVTPADRSQVALVAGVSPTSSGYTNNLGAMRSTGLIDYPQPGKLALTAEGAALAQPGVEISTTDELVDTLANRLGSAKGDILRSLVAAHPAPLARDHLAERVGKSPKSSGFTNNLGALRSLGFIDYPSPGYVIATDALFIEAPR